jgi:hypothetical protein
VISPPAGAHLGTAARGVFKTFFKITIIP